MITMTGALSLKGLKSLSRDDMGVFASSLCVAHCVLTPVVLIALPFAGLAFLENEAVDRSLALVAIAVAVIAFIPGYRMHESKKLIALVSAGIACLLHLPPIPYGERPVILFSPCWAGVSSCCLTS